VISGISAINIVLSTQSPLVDTTTNCPLNVTLPIELTYFSATPLPEKHVKLEWTTASEINNDYFIIEKSADGIRFEEAAKIIGAGSSTSILNYTFTDTHLQDAPIIIYYRLKQVDYNGAAALSKIVPVKFSNKDFELIKTFIDHDNQSIKIFLNNYSGENAAYKLIDVFGKTISQGSPAITNGVSCITINGKNLSRGIYYFSVQNGKSFLTVKIFY
ncbi:MAG: hypothetical protein ABI855_17410, partial [Bacteroidota bacterium]